MLKIRDQNDSIIVAFNSNEIHLEDIDAFVDVVQVSSDRNIFLNLDGVKLIHNDTLRFLKNVSTQKKLFLYNLETDFFILLNLIGYDKYFYIYQCEENILDARFEIKNRRFKIV